MIDRGIQVGTLYVVATPIGNLHDMTDHAISVLKKVAAIAVEDTRHSRKLLQHFSIDTPMFALHDFNELSKVERVIERIKAGESIALISDAGTPLISDPGYQLVKHAHSEAVKVSPVPGASAVIAALSCAGLPSDRFIFEGFLPSKTVARVSTFEKLLKETRTLIFYEAPHRILASLEDMKTVFGGDRFVVLAREMTKTFETIHGDNLGRLLEWVTLDANQQKGEFVVLVRGAQPEEQLALNGLDEQHLKILDTLMSELPLKQAAGLTAKITGIKKNKLYQIGLSRKL